MADIAGSIACAALSGAHGAIRASARLYWGKYG